MKFTLGWLKDHLDTDASLNDIVLQLTAVGLEVEGVTDRAATYAPFKVAYVEKAEKHPDADRLRVLVVDTGTEKLQVVCGAPNARAGMKGVFAPAGSYVPGTGITLQKGNIRGQDSNGMMVSEREMGLSDEHEGIIDLPADTPVGTPFAEIYGLNDPLIEINVTPNRADCACVRGIARDLAAAGLGTLKPIQRAAAVTGTFASPVKISLETPHCPLFLGRYIRGVKNGPSPKWLQDRLTAVGLRPISALVDITNYLTLDLNRPLHVFDADRLKGDIVVRTAKGGETLEALNGKSYTLAEGMVAVCDDSGVLGLGGIVGGTPTGCTEGTVNVYLECALFDALRTARTGRALQIDSDARYRFERGIDPVFTLEGIEIATNLIIELCGGKASDVVKAGDVPSWQRDIAFDPAYTTKLAGIDLPADRQTDILKRLGFTINGDRVQPPSWRGDVEGKADLVEEIVRIHGYDHLEATSVRSPEAVTDSGETPGFARQRRTRAALAARGMNETVTWSFMRRDRAEMFGANDHQAADALRIKNPINAEMDQMRPSILPNLIEAAGRNAARGFGDAALFEVGPTFATAKVNGQSIVAAGIRTGKSASKHWSGPQTSRPVDAYDAKADALAAIAACEGPADNMQISRDAPSWYHPGRSGSLRLGPTVLATFGEVHPALLEQLDVDGPVVAFEVFLDRLPQPRKKEGSARPLLKLSPFQPVKRDFAFIVADKVEADAIVKAARSADKTLIAAAEIFDVYAGKGVEPGHKSVAIAVTLQPVERTLTDAEIESVAQKIVAAVIGKTGGTLRG